jgi:hypothetical protein
MMTSRKVRTAETLRICRLFGLPIITLPSKRLRPLGFHPICPGRILGAGEASGELVMPWPAVR